MLPALAITLLASRHPILSAWFHNAAMYSLFPLVLRDNLLIPYVLLSMLWNFLCHPVLNGTFSRPIRVL